MSSQSFPSPLPGGGGGCFWQKKTKAKRAVGNQTVDFQEEYLGWSSRVKKIQAPAPPRETQPNQALPKNPGGTCGPHPLRVCWHANCWYDQQFKIYPNVAKLKKVNFFQSPAGKMCIFAIWIPSAFSPQFPTVFPAFFFKCLRHQSPPAVLGHCILFWGLLLWIGVCLRTKSFCESVYSCIFSHSFHFPAKISQFIFWLFWVLPTFFGPIFAFFFLVTDTHLWAIFGHFW